MARMNTIAVSLAAVLLLFASSVHAEPLCFEEAGTQYGINPRILRAIAKVESNYNPRAINWNTNGTYDFGVMQINSIWAGTLGKDRWDSLGDPCSNIKTGAMILSGCMKKYGYSWEAIGCYNSQTPDKRDKYAMTVFKQLQRIERDEKQLKENFQSALREGVDRLVIAEQNGHKENRTITVRSGDPVTGDVLRNLTGLTAGGQPNAQELTAPELRASSQFEIIPSGL